MAEWVSFAELRGRVSMENILGHYGLIGNLKPQKGGDELVGLCPFHGETKGSFHTSLSKNAWQCFGCKRHGNILDFVAAKEEVDIRQAAALMIQGWFPGEPTLAPEPPQNATGAIERAVEPLGGTSLSITT